MLGLWSWIVKENTLVTVNNFELSIEEVFGLMFLLDGFELRDTLKNYFGILEFAASRNVTPHQDDVQRALNNLRYELGMERASNFETWCIQNKINKNTLVLVSRINACSDLIKASFNPQELKQEYEQFIEEESLYGLFCLPISDKKLASEIFSDIQTGKMSYSEAVQRYGDDEVLSEGGYIGKIPRIELPEEYAEEVISASAGKILSPIEYDKEWIILYLHEIVTPTFQESDIILRERLFEKNIEYFVDRVVVQRAF